MRRTRRAVVGGTSRLTLPQAGPPPAGRGNGAGIITPDTGALRLPPGLTGPDTSKEPDPDKVVMVIAGLALVFIAVIAWFVSQMPAKN